MTKLIPQEEQLIRDFNNRLSKKVEIDLLLTDDEQSEKINEFCDTLERLALAIKVNRSKIKDDQLPGIQVSKRLCFHAVPFGTQLEPFLEALEYLDEKPVDISGPVRSRLDRTRTPALLKLYIARQCPYCPVMARQMIPLTFANKFVDLTVTDGTLFPDLAKSDRIMSAPTLLFNENVRWTGLTPLADIVDIISNLDPSGLSASALEGILKEGNAPDVARMMIESGKVFPGIIDLLAHGKWPARLGAIVAIEYVSEEDIELAAQYVDPLLKYLPSMDDTSVGDILYIFGMVGKPDVIPELKSILRGRNSTELREAFQEAAENIRGRRERNDE